MSKRRCSIPPWQRCAMDVRAVVERWTNHIAPGHFGELFRELRDEIDGLEMELKKRTGHAHVH